MNAFVARTCSFAATDSGLQAERSAYERMCQAFTPPTPAGVQWSDARWSGVDVRCYRPPTTETTRAGPWILYLHGGGWCVGSLESHRFICAELTQLCSVPVVAVDYRLAPEHPFPAALDDCLAVLQAVEQGLAAPALDPQRCLVMGDSAGGNLAAALCLALRDRGAAQPLGQLLIYPGLGGAADLPSRQECADAPLLSREDIEVYQNAYVSPESRRHPYALPLCASDYRALAPAFVAVAQWDPLRDDGECYHRRLREAGVPSTLYPGLGLVHGCLRGRRTVPEVDDLYESMVEWLQLKLQR